ncbi:hypothetical protein FBU30_007184 [Linnemannia zychae]|nr:hypothetical protein FBU30_007184 [Linnemannia zychae]
MSHTNKQPLNLRKTASKNSTKKLQQQQQQLSGRVISSQSSKDEDDEDGHVARRQGEGNSGGGEGYEYWEVEYGLEHDEDGNIARERSIERQILDAIEQLGEKRSSTREEALTRLLDILSQYYVPDLVDSHKDDLVDLLKRSIKRGGTRECILAANVISLVFITTGEQDEQVLIELAPLLKYTIANHDQPESRAACLYTLATACYISSTPQPSHLPTYDLLDYLVNLIMPKDTSSAPSSSFSGATPVPSETLVAALESFGFLYAALFGRGSSARSRDNESDNDEYEGSYIDGHEGYTGLGASTIATKHKRDLQQARQLFNKLAPTIHYTLLEHPSVEVRVASGEVIGLMFEILDYHERQRQRHEDLNYEQYQQEKERIRRESETYGDQDEWDEWNEDGDRRVGGKGRGWIAPMSMMTTTGPFKYMDRQDLVDVLGNLATDSNRHRSRKDRSAGRSAFRDIVKSVELDQISGIGDDDDDVDDRKPQETLKLKDYIVEFIGWGAGIGKGTFHSYRRDSRPGSQFGSRAGSRPASSLGNYSDGGNNSSRDDFASIEQIYALKQQQKGRKVDRKQNGDVAKLRHVQRKKDRGRGRGRNEEIEF